MHTGLDIKQFSQCRRTALADGMRGYSAEKCLASSLADIYSVVALCLYGKSHNLLAVRRNPRSVKPSHFWRLREPVLAVIMMTPVNTISLNIISSMASPALRLWRLEAWLAIRLQCHWPCSTALPVYL